MTLTRLLLPALLVASAAGGVGAFQPTQPSFQNTTTGVRVSVSVREGNRTVAGLSAADFVLTDNEVEQEIQALSVESVPVDATLIVDTSGSTAGVASRLAEAVQQITRLLRPDDAFRLIRIDTFVAELRPMARVTAPVAVDAIPRQNGASAVHDALVAALVKPVAPGRRHLVIAISDCLDTISITTADRVREVAARSEARLEIVTVRPPDGYRAPLSYQRPRYTDQDTLVLTEAAESTGGELRSRGLFGDPDPVGAFKRVYDEFRQSYVLHYTPRDVDSSGWHELTVTVPKAPNATVRARKGYYGEGAQN